MLHKPTRFARKLLKRIGIVLVALTLVLTTLPFSSFVLPSQEVLANPGQTFYPIDPVEVTPGTAGVFTDVNVSAYIPEGATGVILHLVNNDTTGSRAIGLRKNGSTDNRTRSLFTKGHCWAAVGVDANRIFETYISDTTYNDIYLVAYTVAGVTFFTNAYDKSMTTLTTWEDIDCSAVAPNAIGLIFEINGNATEDYGYGFGLRKNGSTDTWVSPNRGHSGFGAIIGCDASQICEGYIQDATVDFYLVGYITDGCVFNTNGIENSLSTEVEWLDLAPLPEDSIMGFFEMRNPNEDAYGLRKNGSAEDIYQKCRMHPWMFVECDANHIIEAKIQDPTYVDFFVIGYATASSIVAPTVTTSAASSVEATTATLNGNITVTGGENPTVTVYWGDNDGGQVIGNWDYSSVPTSPSQPQGVAAFYYNATGLPTGTTLYFSAKATNSGGTGWGTTQTFLTKPAAPTSIAATDGTYTDKVTVTWTKATGATGYRVYEGVNLLDTLGDVATYDDTAAPAPVITPGTADATDGTHADYVTLSLAGESVANGTSRTYKVVALNATGDSDDSATNAGYRGHGALTYQWQRSAADSDADYSNITLATTDPYNDTAGVVTPDGRYYKCVLSATGAANQTSTADRGYKSAGATAPTITNSTGASLVETTTARLNGNLTDDGGADTTVYIYWGDNDGNTTPGSWDYNINKGILTEGAFYSDITDLLTGTTYYYRCYATNSEGSDWADSTATLLTKPAAPTNVAATDNLSNKVTITWTKSTGATDYHVWRDTTDLGAAGDVATFDDTGASAPTITPGSSVATDGSSTAQVSLSLSGTGTNNGTTHTYKVVASNATGNSADSSTDTGYRAPGTLTYQWQKSSGDADSGYSNIDGATSSTYNDTAAPAPTITYGTTSASDGTYSAYVRLSLAGESANVGAGRYYKCILNASGCVQQTSTSNRGYRGVGSLTYQWQRSSGDSDADYSNIIGGTTDPYNDTGAPENGDGRYYKCVLDATGATQQTSSANRGYRDNGTSPAPTTDGGRWMLEVLLPILAAVICISVALTYGSWTTTILTVVIAILIIIIVNVAL